MRMSKKAKVLVTGSAGFIGFHLTRKLLMENYAVVGVDNLNSYYDVNLKYARLNEVGISNLSAFEQRFQKAGNNTPLKQEEKLSAQNPLPYGMQAESTKNADCKFICMNLEDRENILQLFKEENFDMVVNLAAQAGVRYSIENPYTYIEANINGFLNILEGCRHNAIMHLVYASSSSVYGLNKKMPLSTSDNVDHPISLYAATKKADELMAHTYSHLYKIPTTGLRFFTVYGPWGRPDMALFKFTKAILNDEPIEVYNYGNMQRDFTYVSDIVDGIYNVMQNIPEEPEARDAKASLNPSCSPAAPYRLFNIGNSSPVMLNEFIEAIEKSLGKKAKKKLMPMQAGDVPATFADVSDLMKITGYKPNTTIQEGIKAFVEWYKTYFKIS